MERQRDPEASGFFPAILLYNSDRYSSSSSKHYNLPQQQQIEAESNGRPAKKERDR